MSSKFSLQFPRRISMCIVYRYSHVHAHTHREDLISQNRDFCNKIVDHNDNDLVYSINWMTCIYIYFFLLRLIVSNLKLSFSQSPSWQRLAHMWPYNRFSRVFPSHKIYKIQYTIIWNHCHRVNESVGILFFFGCCYLAHMHIVCDMSLK